MLVSAEVVLRHVWVGVLRSRKLQKSEIEFGMTVSDANVCAIKNDRPGWLRAVSRVRRRSGQFVGFVGLALNGLN